MGLFMFFATAGSRGRPRGASSSTPIPFLSTWESNMTTYGTQWGQYMSSGATDAAKQLAGYYDYQWVAFQIYDYTGDSAYLTYAEDSEAIYRDYYCVPNNFALPGYWRFPHGLYEDYIRSGTPAGTKTTIQQVRDIRDNPAYSDPDISQYASGWYHALNGREIAYAVHAQLCAEKAGEARQTDHMTPYIAMLENHLYQWRNNDYTTPTNGLGTDADYMQPFMVGLVCHALIDFVEWEEANARSPETLWPTTHWSTIQAAIQDILDWMYNTAVIVGAYGTGERVWAADTSFDIPSNSWTPIPGTGYGAFRYTDRYTPLEYGSPSAPSTSPDLNLLICPAYAWIYKRTGNTAFRDAADRIFEGGVLHSSIDFNGKIFTQNYRWSFKYVEWRS